MDIKNVIEKAELSLKASKDLAEEYRKEKYIEALKNANEYIDFWETLLKIICPNYGERSEI